MGKQSWCSRLLDFRLQRVHWSWSWVPRSRWFSSGLVHC
ncbi:hypothetical protein NC651_013949 [Populus alba x Populus x berolinensis]|nr:hypothetical protein NC651_013949 [Populus alba x Populus x berolinensis]